MFSFSRILVVAALAFSALAAPEPTRTSRDSLVDINPVGVVTRSIPQKPAVHLTNAQRFARGLPPNRPRARYGRRAQALQPRQSSTTAVRSGYIQAVIAGYGTGYVSKNLNAFGEYQYTTDISSALSVSFAYDSSTSSTFDIATLNGASGFDYLGFGTGYGNTNTPDAKTLTSNSYNYAYLLGVPQEPRGPAVQVQNSFTFASGLTDYSESNVWTISATNELVPSWVNTDGSVVIPTIYYNQDEATFVITGDGTAFTTAFGVSGSYMTTFTFVSA